MQRMPIPSSWFRTLPVLLPSYPGTANSDHGASDAHTRFVLFGGMCRRDRTTETVPAIGWDRVES